MKTMAITGLIIVLMLVVPGCVAARYNAETKDISYIRVGPQKLTGVLAEITDPNGQNISLIVESQESDADMLQNAIKLYEAGRAAK